MLFTQNFLDELRNRVSIAETVGRTVKLTRKGREFSGLCPFHSEKTPSFTVSEEKSFYHCFGCGAHGDVIKFVMQTQNLSFSEAVEQLADQAGLPVPKQQPTARSEAEQSKRQELLNITAFAQNWFAAQLRDNNAGNNARHYLQKRGLSAETIQKFSLGYAPDSRDGLRQALLKAGFREELAIEAGLVIKADDRANYDRFRDRVMFPIPNLKGSAIAFGGRILAQGEPKYLNSPESPIFHKGHVVFALPFATAAAGKERSIVVVEGYMDAIALHQAGIQNVVANLGTALTENHIQLLWRYADRILLCFDGDNAGLRAAARAAERVLPLLRVGKEVRFVMIPQGHDPDTYVQAYGKQAFIELCHKATPFHEKLLEVELISKPTDTPEGKADFYRRLRQHLSQIKDTILREEYRHTLYDRVKTLFGKNKPVSRGQFPSNFNRKFAPRLSQNLPKNPDGVRRKEAEALLAACILYPQLLLSHAEELGQLTMQDADLETLRQSLIELALRDGIHELPNCTPHLPEQLQSLAEIICDESRRLFMWLRNDTADLVAKWETLLFTFRYQQDHPPSDIAAESLLSEEGWNRFLQQQQSQTETSREIETTLLGTAIKK